MSKKYNNGLFIFRRDLRIIDNVGLNLLNAHCANIYTIFIFTPEQVTDQNKFKSEKAVQFMLDSLADLSAAINKYGGKLYTFYGENEKVVAHCVNMFKIDVVGFNIDYTPYARKRDESLSKLGKALAVDMAYAHDYYLHQPGSILTLGHTPYKKFTPYYESALKIPIDSPMGLKTLHLAKKNALPAATYTIALADAQRKFTSAHVGEFMLVRGGRVNAKKKLALAMRSQKHYSTTHNNLANSTSQLSAYIKFGCVSIREVYQAFKHNRDFIRQLIWRDFYANILFAFPQVLGHAMKPNYNKITWSHTASSAWFKAWCAGQTGYPVVDAGMRQLNQTGYMHNRARLIVASFLVKTLLISWENGEKYFATKLTDYDPASNNGNWQWIASTGADSQPYFRIFNPTEQGKRFDPACDYIKAWLPELHNVEPKIIHNWPTVWMEHKDIKYVKPICDYKEQKTLALKMYGAL